MKKYYSLKQNYEFRRVYRRGKSVADSFMAVYLNKSRGKRIGISVSNKIGKACVRNKIKRRIKNLYTLNYDKIPWGQDIVVVARAKSNGATYSELQKSFERNLKKLSVWNNKNEENT